VSKHLHEKKCVPCEGGTKPMEKEGVQKYLTLISGWEVQGGIKIAKEFSFDDFEHALTFVNAVGRIAEEEGHHPDILLFDYKHTRITLSTHAIGGLSMNDFILASKIDRI